jgi:hypothetical protein
MVPLKAKAQRTISTLAILQHANRDAGLLYEFASETARLFMRTCEGSVHLMQLSFVFDAQVAGSKQNINSLDFAGKREWRLIGIRDRRASVRPNTEGIDAEASRDSVRDPSATYLPAIDSNDGLATLA